MKNNYLIVLVLLMYFPSVSSASKSVNSQSFELLLGSAWNMRENIRIKQDGEPDIVIKDAHFDVEPFTRPIYYGFRWAFFVGEDGAWELEMNHLKMYLSNPPSEVDHLEVSHGYNLVWLNRAWYINEFIIHTGAGVVVPHPDIMVRGKTDYDPGLGAYTIAGPSLHASVQKKFDISESWFISLETKVVVASAYIQIAEGSVVVPNRSFHANFGFGYEF